MDALERQMDLKISAGWSIEASWLAIVAMVVVFACIVVGLVLVCKVIRKYSELMKARSELDAERRQFRNRTPRVNERLEVDQPSQAKSIGAVKPARPNGEQ